MQYEESLELVNVLGHAFESGFENARQSLVRLSGDKIQVNNFHQSLCSFRELGLKDELYSLSTREPKVLLTTDVFGELTGKSYLFLSAREIEHLTANVPQISTSINLKEEFIKELDNILSAAVITELSNRLKKKIYGDIPLLIGNMDSFNEETIRNDFEDISQKIYVNSMVFEFEGYPQVQPLFIWAIDYNVA